MGCEIRGCFEGILYLGPNTSSAINSSCLAISSGSRSMSEGFPVGSIWCNLVSIMEMVAICRWPPFFQISLLSRAKMGIFIITFIKCFFRLYYILAQPSSIFVSGINTPLPCRYDCSYLESLQELKEAAL